MIYKRGNAFGVDFGVLVHGCNLQGKMGSGFAKEFRQRYPQAYEKYVTDIGWDKVKLGDISLYGHTPQYFLASGITQENYGSDGKKYISYDALDSVMDKVFSLANKLQFPVHMPKIGAGLGGGDWSVITTIISTNAKKYNFDENNIFIWEL